MADKESSLPASPFANATDVITSLLKDSVLALENQLNGDVISYKGPLFAPADRMVRDALESIQPKREKLVFILETEGGHLEPILKLLIGK